MMIVFFILLCSTSLKIKCFFLFFFYLTAGWLDADILGCFQFLTDLNLVWLEAQQKCETLGGYLAEPKTAWYVM
jgi:hypothetical protein